MPDIGRSASGDNEDGLEDDTAPDAAPDAAPDTAAPTGRPWTRPSAGRWLLFAALATVVAAADQLTKAWVVGSLAQGEGFEVLGDWIRIIHWRNSGILFGMLPESAGAFAIASLIVAGLIVAYHARAGRGLVVTLALGLLLGGAIGNLIDRVHYGSVIDFVDMGIGAWRFYTYNAADAAISTAIVMLVAMAAFPRIAEWGPDA